MPKPNRPKLLRKIKVKASTRKVKARNKARMKGSSKLKTS